MNCKFQRLVKAFISSIPVTLPATLLTVAMGIRAEGWFMWAITVYMGIATMLLGWWFVYEGEK